MPGPLLFGRPLALQPLKAGCRYKPGTLTDVQSRLLGLPPQELTLCMTDVAGSTALWEWDAVVMNKALAIQEECLRGLLSRHFGHEVGSSSHLLHRSHDLVLTQEAS